MVALAAGDIETPVDLFEGPGWRLWILGSRTSGGVSDAVKGLVLENDHEAALATFPSWPAS